ncbi:MAG: preprotein translocase subunit SecG [Alphaproteobacteria bacterium]|jgi:preprotein translocase subunit SecG|nr:preprotein translocase subunit SecG [Alphaproteobacteria bacterium]MBU1281040.1 preprotein translocase subunit SecG [Alphaproteobacteria bacterium]MBU1575008.1 preprotein translocase subunit SecG [Alphaproteobacteria bacterium]MBU1830078.1 preprotein translocase subunit SecG [Alphaproteobacteria bacterium]MBU2079065.1 preprotein translocase subunit SecG [Alphaproteobacteria bacterium]
MENVILVIHLILALCLIGIVLLQRSEGGGLGMGGGGDVMTGRAAATALGKLTWIFAIGFLCTSLTLTVLARRDAATSSVMDGVTIEDTAPAETTTPALPSGDSLLPPSADAPIEAPRAD